MKEFKNFCKGLAIFVVVAGIIFMIITIIMSHCNGNGWDLVAEWQRWFGIVAETAPAVPVEPVVPPVEETSAILLAA